MERLKTCCEALAAEQTQGNKNLNVGHNSGDTEKRSDTKVFLKNGEKVPTAFYLL
jgi:hypothetical protein